jgi:FkbM family methyltransferase
VGILSLRGYYIEQIMMIRTFKFAYQKRRDRLFYRGIRYVLTHFFYAHHRIRLKIEQYRMPLSAIKTVHGNSMILDLRSDQGISRRLFIFGTHEGTSVQYLQESGILRPGDVAIDIGANIGYYALLESKIVGKTGVVYALEPIQDVYVQLLTNIKKNNITNIFPYNVAAGNKNGLTTAHVGYKRNHSSLQPRPGAQSYVRTETVHEKRIDDFLEGKERPHFIRMDVEGYEHAILTGMIKTLKNSDRISCHIEIHPDVMSEDETRHFFTLLQEAGLTTCTILHEPYDEWHKWKTERIRPSIAFLTNLIGDTARLGGPERVSFEYVQDVIIKEKRQLRIIFSKGI